MKAARHFALVLATLSIFACRTKEDVRLEPLRLGGDFELTGTGGRPFRLSSLRGRAVLLFFGSTARPDIGSSTIERLGRANALLEMQGCEGSFATVFVSVGSARDEPERLREYLSYFALPIHGATGTAAQVAPVLRSYGSSFAKAPVDSAAKEGIAPSTFVYLIDPLGRTVHLFGRDGSPEEIARLVSQVLDGHPCGTVPSPPSLLLNPQPEDHREPLAHPL